MPIYLKCPEGHEVKVRSMSRRAGELICPTHRKPLVLPSSKTLGKRRSAAEQRAAARFESEVCSEPCFFSDKLPDGSPRREDHVCGYPLDPHHLIPKSWIELYIDLPEDELLALKYNPIIGAPLCRVAHDAVEYSPSECIYRDELAPRLILFCEEWDHSHNDQRSLLGKLYEKCPERRREE